MEQARFIIGSAVSELSACAAQSRLVAAATKKELQVWDFVSGGLLSEFSTIFSSGARNIAIDPFGAFVAVGRSSSRGHVSLHELPTGKLIWKVKASHYPSSLRFDPEGKVLRYASKVNANSFRVVLLDVSSGDVLEVLPGVRHMFVAPDGTGLTEGGRAEPYALGASSKILIPRASGAIGVLDAAFGAGAVCFTEANGPTRCVGCEDGTELWRYTPELGMHVLRLSFSISEGAFFGIGNQRENDVRGRDASVNLYLLRFDASTGACSRVCQLDSPENSFVHSADLVAASNGDIIDIRTGAIKNRLSFTRKAYPILEFAPELNQVRRFVSPSDPPHLRPRPGVPRKPD